MHSSWPVKVKLNTWESATVEELFYVKGRIGWRGLRRSQFTDHGPYLITGMHISEGKVQWDDCFHISEDKFQESPEIMVEAGDIIITKDGTIGKVAHIDYLPGLASLNSHLFLVRPRVNRVDRRFAYHVFTSWLFNQHINDHRTGSTISGLSEKLFLQFNIPLPPLQEQRRIANILDTIDIQIQHTKQLITQLKLQKAGLLQDLLTHGLNERGQLRDPVAHLEEFKESMLGMIPKTWEIKNLASISLKVTDGCHQSVTTTPNNGIPFLFVSCIRNGQILWERSAKISEEVYKIISKGREPKSGVILYTIVGSYGHAAMTQSDHPFSFQRHIAYILPDTTIIVPLFLTYWLNSIWSRSYADKIALGNAQKTIILSELNCFPVILPSREEQCRIIAIIEKQDELIRIEETYLNKLRLYKEGLMQDLLSGSVHMTTE